MKLRCGASFENGAVTWMRILLVNTLFPPIVRGGAELSTAKLAAGLAAKGHDVHVLTMTPDTVATEAVNGIMIHRVIPSLVEFPEVEHQPGPLGKMVYHAIENYNPRMYRMMRAKLADIKPDVVHSNVLQLFTCAIWFAAKHEGVPVVHNLRDYWLLCARSGFFRNGETCSRTCVDCAVIGFPRRNMTSAVDGVVAVGQYVLDRHLQAGLFKQVKVARAILSATDPVAVAEYPTRPGRPITLGYIGRIKESKGVHILLEAMAKVPVDAGVRLVIAGGGEEAYLDRLKDMADPRSEFIGWSKPEDFYRQVDVVAIPSLYPEPLPRTVLEAYSYGLPVIGAVSGGIPEVVQDGRTGWLYEGARQRAARRDHFGARHTGRPRRNLARCDRRHARAHRPRPCRRPI